MTEHENAIYIAARIVLWMCVALSILFPVLYHARSHGFWMRTPVGRHVMAFRATFALLLLFTGLSLYLPTITTLYASLILYGLALIGLAEQIKFLFDPRSMDPDDLLDEHYEKTDDEGTADDTHDSRRSFG